jgi:hypothetical protein
MASATPYELNEVWFQRKLVKKSHPSWILAEQVYSRIVSVEYSLPSTGRRARIALLPDESNGGGKDKPGPNIALEEALGKIREVHEKMNPKQGKDSLEYLREARGGGMYGNGGDD